MATIAMSRIEVASLSDIGRKRKNNEDRVGFDEEAGIFVVCDGMGGMAAGEVASSMTVEHILKTFRELGSEAIPVEERLHRAIASANEAVWKMAQQDPQLDGMGTTLVAACVNNNTLVIANVGDSRAYFLRGGSCVQVTEDHSCVVEYQKHGGFGSLPPSMRQMITRAIGAEPHVCPDLYLAELKAGDRVLLATDGLTRYTNESDLALQIYEERDLQSCCQRLIAIAHDKGGEDNVTCLLMRFR